MKSDVLAVNAIRVLAADAIEKAGSGHNMYLRTITVMSGLNRKSFIVAEMCCTGFPMIKSSDL